VALMPAPPSGRLDRETRENPRMARKEALYFRGFRPFRVIRGPNVFQFIHCCVFSLIDWRLDFQYFPHGVGKLGVD